MDLDNGDGAMSDIMLGYVYVETPHWTPGLVLFSVVVVAAFVVGIAWMIWALATDYTPASDSLGSLIV